MKLFDRLVQDTKETWDAYVNHEFKTKISDGTLSFDRFKNYIVQDYLYLLEFKRIFDLLESLGETQEEKEFAAVNSKSIIDLEIGMQKEVIEYAGEFLPAPSKETSAYINFLYQVAHGGDYLELLIALSSCSIGYYILGSSIKNETTDHKEYKEWIEVYRSDSYKEYVEEYKEFIENISSTQEICDIKYNELVEIFEEATRLEIDFFGQGK